MARVCPALGLASDLVATAVSGPREAPLVASPLAAVEPGQTRHQGPVLVTPQQLGAEALRLAELQPGQRGRHRLTHTPTRTRPPSCSDT